MKTCPVCQAIAFDDARQCFGCLHDFGMDCDLADGAVELAHEPPSGAKVDRQTREDACISFTVRLIPEAGACGDASWRCVIDAPKMQHV